MLSSQSSTCRPPSPPLVPLQAKKNGYVSCEPSILQARTRLRWLRQFCLDAKIYVHQKNSLIKKHNIFILCVKMQIHDEQNINIQIKGKLRISWRKMLSPSKVPANILFLSEWVMSMACPCLTLWLSSVPSQNQLLWPEAWMICPLASANQISPSGIRGGATPTQTKDNEWESWLQKERP